MTFAMVEGEEKHRRKRSYAPKVKTGCITCKVRRVKCDEAKPSCLRCTSTGRTCDGYVLDKARTTEAEGSPLVKHNAAFFPRNFQNGGNIAMFYQKTAPRIAGFYDPTFWNRIVVQLAHVEPAVHNAMNAVSRLYDQVELLGGEIVPDMDQQALQSYTKAIRCVVNENGSKENRAYVSLVVCALFVCLEFLRGNASDAVTHIEGGYKILQDWRQTSPTSSQAGSPSYAGSVSSPESTASSSERDLMDEMTSLFSRLHVQSLMFGNATEHDPVISRPEELIPAYTFHSINEARDVNFKILNHAMNLIREGAPAKYNNSVTMEMVIQQIQIEAEAREWRRALDVFIKKEEKALLPTDVRGANMLKTHNLACLIWVLTCLNPEETQFDRFTKVFEEITQLAASILDMPAEYLCNSVGRFQFDMGLLPTLHFVGQRCRFPHVRNKVLRILATTRWREAIFDSFRTYRHIRTFMELENVATEQLLGLNPSEVSDYLPPESARIHFADFNVKIDAETGMQSYTFFSKPNGVHGKWAMQTKLVSTSPTNPEKDACSDGRDLGDGWQPVPDHIEKNLFIDMNKRTS